MGDAGSGERATERDVHAVATGVGGARLALGGGGGGPTTGAWRRDGGRQSGTVGTGGDHTWDGRAGQRGGRAARYAAAATAWGRTETADRAGSDVAPRPGGAGGPDGPGRPPVGAALDVQEPEQAGR